MRSRLYVAAAAALFLMAGSTSASGPAPVADKPALGTFGIDTTQMDPAVKPGDDFFKYVNGKWLDSFTIPADKASYGMFDRLTDKAEEDVRTLLTELAAKPQPAGSVAPVSYTHLTLPTILRV